MNMSKRCHAMPFWLVLLLPLWLLSGCARAQVQMPGPGEVEPELGEDHFIAADAYAMPLTRWLPEGEIKQVVLALHGFNDFRQSHLPLARKLSARGSAIYAYDQRGFGATAQRGIWPGQERLVEDARTALALLSQRYPDKPLYLLGESMGAAVSILTTTETEAALSADALTLDGMILMAPAVWAREEQPWYQRLGLWLGIRVAPGMKVDSDWVAVEPTDDPDWAEYWDEHPLVLQRSRIDALEGISLLMSDALAASEKLNINSLVLYGGKDEVVPKEAICALVKRLPEPDDVPWRMAYYPEGWHFLARDSRADETLEDITAWLEDHDGALPSERMIAPADWRQAHCE
ncbi:alpha/beta fold hydrolase [Gammaproteobacteria bacterium AB-CW1]|uniref:Alpha/beta fold hydrolase n=1 Tax=Natronospira elongata TaxID=3110268 RepID=A0AAP6JE76_9GAMM|nr:alpha/beta fold hydrolase [Gammaproteobacteria bacterium AB-CW1]